MKVPGNTTILNGPGDHPNTGVQGPSNRHSKTACHKEQLHLHPQAPSQARVTNPRLPPVNHQDAATREGSPTQSPTNKRIKIQVKIIRGLADHKGTTSRSTSTPKDSGKGPRAPGKAKKKSSEPYPSTSTDTDYTSQGHRDPSRYQIQCSACGEYSHWSKDCPYYNFSDICKVTTHSTCMCRASKCSDTPTRLPVCIYCGKTNHRSVNCRYQPWDKL